MIVSREKIVLSNNAAVVSQLRRLIQKKDSLSRTYKDHCGQGQTEPTFRLPRIANRCEEFYERRKNMTLVGHTKGSRFITKDELSLLEVPAKTESYTPVPHNQLVETIEMISKDMLSGYSLVKSQYLIAREGQRLFAVVVFGREGDSELGLTVGFRNSYDKSMAIGIAIGANVFVCDNLAFTGDITILKKHTLNVWKNLEDATISTLYRSQKTFNLMAEDFERMKAWPLSDEEAFRNVGLLYGKGLLTPRQLPVVKREWMQPSCPEFEERTMWSFYNACTEALKSCPPMVVMEKHVACHSLLSLRDKPF